MTLLEVLLVVAVMGLLLAAGITGLGRLSKNQAYQGYVAGLGQAVSDATTRANETNTVYALAFDQTGYRWGPVGGTVAACTGASSAPTIGTAVLQRSAPAGVATSPSGWLCFSAPGLVGRLTALGATCAYKSYTFPCLTFSGVGKDEHMFISVGGQVVVQ
jgi:type II secretory pathway pseudopilin PulG